MLIPIELKEATEIPSFYKRISTFTSVYKVTQDRLIFYDGEYIISKDITFDGTVKPLKKVGSSASMGNVEYEILRSKYDEHHEIIKVLAHMYIRVRSFADYNNLVFSIKRPYLYITRFLIRENKPYKGKNNISKVKPTNTVIGLSKLKDIPKDPFVTLKIDGETTIISYLMDHGIFAFDLRGKELFRDLDVHKRGIYDDNVIFLAEYHNDCFYLFMEANDLYEDFRIDYEHMHTFANAYGNTNRIRVNYMVLSSPTNPSHQQIIQDILDIKVNLPEINGRVPETDGIVIGSISTKMHYKWKPPDLLTIDFYLLFKEGLICMYVGDRIYNARKSMKRSRKKIPVPYIIGSGQYVSVLFLTQQVKDPDKYSEWKTEYDKKIVECKRIDGEWIPFRHRPDKDVPNNIKTAKSNVYILNHPIKISDLIV